MRRWARRRARRRQRRLPYTPAANSSAAVEGAGAPAGRRRASSEDSAPTPTRSARGPALRACPGRPARWLCPWPPPRRARAILFAARPRLVARDVTDSGCSAKVPSRRVDASSELLRRFVVSGLAETRLGACARDARARGARAGRVRGGGRAGRWSGSWRRTRTGTGRSEGGASSGADARSAPWSLHRDRLRPFRWSARAEADAVTSANAIAVAHRETRLAAAEALRASVADGLVRPNGDVPRGRRLPNGPVQPVMGARARGRAGVGGSLGGVARRLRRAHEGGRRTHRRGAGDERRVPATASRSVCFPKRPPAAVTRQSRAPPRWR